MNVIVDIGNSRIKVVVFDGSHIVSQHITEEVSLEWLGEIVNGYPQIRRAIVSSTRGEVYDVVELLQRYAEYVLCFEPATTPVPIGNRYHTPETLGADRLAAAVGAAMLYEGSDLMIVDFGTAITIDYVVDGAFCGGNISPGVTTRFRALADYTARLPLCSATEQILEYGRTTREAIEQGVMQGITYEIEGYIEAFTSGNEKKYVIFTGGDAKYFEKRIKNAIFADCEPVVYGLNRILNYNADKI